VIELRDPVRQSIIAQRWAPAAAQHGSQQFDSRTARQRVASEIPNALTGASIGTAR
jgi:hypothetical protein